MLLEGKEAKGRADSWDSCGVATGLNLLESNGGSGLGRVLNGSNGTTPVNLGGPGDDPVYA